LESRLTGTTGAVYGFPFAALKASGNGLNGLGLGRSGGISGWWVWEIPLRPYGAGKALSAGLPDHLIAQLPDCLIA
jgi:hypothetical protein